MSNNEKEVLNYFMCKKMTEKDFETLADVIVMHVNNRVPDYRKKIVAILRDLVTQGGREALGDLLKDREKDG